MSFTSKKHLALLLCTVLLLAIIETWHSGFGWWDQQRLYEVILLGVAALFAFKSSVLRLSKPAFSLILIFLGLGLMSALLAHHPWYALTEWALYQLGRASCRGRR